MENSINLMQRASAEIKSLRRQNEIMQARLDMFDAMTQLLHTRPASQSDGPCSPDVVYEIDRFILSSQVEDANEKRAVRQNSNDIKISNE